MPLLCPRSVCSTQCQCRWLDVLRQYHAGASSRSSPAYDVPWFLAANVEATLQMLLESQMALEGGGSRAEQETAFAGVITAVNASTSPRVLGLGGQIIAAVRAMRFLVRLACHTWQVHLPARTTLTSAVLDVAFVFLEQNLERFPLLEDRALETLLRMAVCFDFTARLSALQNVQEVIQKSTSADAERVLQVYSRARGFLSICPSNLDKNKLTRILASAKVRGVPSAGPWVGTHVSQCNHSKFSTHQG